MKQAKSSKLPIEIWGGVECSVVRIDGTVHDQLKMNGHENRIEDLNLFADLGIKKLRYPLLWEKYESQKELFFPLHDERLLRLQNLEITPIAGLLHHGSGPYDMDMLNPEFPEKLADYAQIIAEHYPWIEFYTPVNEPLTTARFSGLYGIWHPHKKDDYLFSRMYLNELKGTILAMTRIRQINPDAKLIQTEDIARVHSTRKLKYQANLENQRTWLTYDILTGHFGPDHPYWNYFIEAGIHVEELEFFRENIHPPHICGFNYYVTSERFLDDRTIEYPDCNVGGNDFHDYADVEVVRVADESLVGIEVLLREAAQRYNLPIALTEIHLACTREEQLRWFNDAWQAVTNLKGEGFDIRGITAWSLLGSYDWNTLLQLKGEYYESGVFDIRSGKPRATALAELIKSYSQNTTVNQSTTVNERQNTTVNESLLQVPGWWKRNVRIKYHIPDDFEHQVAKEFTSYRDIRPIMIFGNGTMALAFEQLCKLRGLPTVNVNKGKSGILNEDEILGMIDLYNPWAIVNTVGFHKIDEAEKSPMNCFRENTLFPRVIAQICRLKSIRMLTFSTDQVFNGKKREPYMESDKTDPINIYGMSKKVAEENVLFVNPEVLIIRSGLLMNPFSSSDFLYEILFKKDNSQDKYAFSDIVVSPTYLPDLINTSLDLLIDKEVGIWHLSGPEAISYLDFANLALGIAGDTNTKIHSLPSISLAMHARRPLYSVLRSASGIVLPPLDLSISNYLADVERNYRA